MRKDAAAFAFVFLAGLACSASEAPAFGGFVCGGFAGDCPPASTCVGVPCDHSDCGGVCRASTPCDPAKSICPNGTVCDAKTDYCMPVRTCTTKSDCQPGAFCITGDGARRYHIGLCVVVPDSAPATCSGPGTCPFPWYCATGCVLACIDGECPGTLDCVQGECTHASPFR